MYESTRNYIHTKQKLNFYQEVSLHSHHRQTYQCWYNNNLFPFARQLSYIAVPQVTTVLVLFLTFPTNYYIF